MAIHRTTTRGILMTALLGLSLGACSFSYSSGSRSSSSAPNHASHGKPVHHSGGGKADTRGKAIPKSGSTGSGKSIGKTSPEPTDPPPPTRNDTADDPPTRTPTADAPQRTKVAPKRTKVPTRTPTDDGDDTVESGVNQAPTASDDLKAKTKSDPPSGGNPSASGNLKAKTKNPPPPSGNPAAGSGKLVAPQ